MSYIVDACELLSESQKTIMATNYFRSVAKDADPNAYYISNQGREMVLHMILKADKTVMKTQEQFCY